MNRVDDEVPIGTAQDLAAQVSPLEAAVLGLFGCLPFARSGGEAMSHLVSEFQGLASAIIAANLGFDACRWRSRRRRT